MRSGSALISTCHITTSNFITYQTVTSKSVDRTFAKVFTHIDSKADIISPCHQYKLLLVSRPKYYIIICLPSYHTEVVSILGWLNTPEY